MENEKSKKKMRLRWKLGFRPRNGNADEDLIIFVKTQWISLYALLHIFILLLLKNGLKLMIISSHAVPFMVIYSIQLKMV
jgi:hypothetical protein